MREIITAPEVVRIADSGQTRLVVASNAIITPAAKDEAVRLGIDVVRTENDHQPLASHETTGSPADEDMEDLIVTIVSRVVGRLSEAENGGELRVPDTAVTKAVLRGTSEEHRSSTDPERFPVAPTHTGTHIPQIIAFDAGGTMTDAFIVDENGQFVVGKAQTTPDDESLSVLTSTKDALDYWGMSIQEAVPTMVSGVFSGTSMINRLLSRQGAPRTRCSTAAPSSASAASRPWRSRLSTAAARSTSTASRGRSRAPIWPPAPASRW